MATDQLIIPKTESWKMFNLISKRYDFMNRVMSFGLDVRWRNKLAAFIPQKPNVKLLDLATGTADVAISLVEKRPDLTVTGLDMAAEMLKIGQAKIEKKGLSSKITLQQGDAQKLPFMDHSFDCLTIAFGIRNIPELRLALMEMFRVLKPGGRAVILEFSMPENPLLRFGDLIYLRYVIPGLGIVFSGNYKAYKYLNQTVEQFPYGDRFCKILKQMGFQNIAAHPLLGGVATIYVGEKQGTP
jgi:demethylmenaquinone methyltransferase / 2-methoxy-6-polyprenyl-1,4-benzoquinol methylase